MSGLRLAVGFIVMGLAVPLAIFFLLHLETPAHFFTVAATTFLSWGVADLLATILERPRLRDRSPARALEEEVERKLRSEP
ncbi:MAG TPA: hypothetical protein VGR02_18570 [Thermoanaerobaculia bacterium]|jgi:hypothetical protein|nr:hypothetical protein [Thermoanaerobaculia bacterium]